MTSLVAELQRDALDWKIPVTQLLQKCRVVAVKLSVKEPTNWVRLELDGYAGSGVELPGYRTVHGAPRVGYQPLVFDDAETQKLFTTLHLTHPISEIEHMLENNGQGLYLTYPPEIEIHLRQRTEFGFPPAIYV